MPISEHGVLGWSWRVVQGRPRLFIGMLSGLAAAPLLPAAATQRNLRVILVATTLLVSWLMTHTTFTNITRSIRMVRASRYDHPGIDGEPRGRLL